MTDFIEEINYRRGDVVFKEGQVGECAFLIRSGAVKIIKRRGDIDVQLGTVNQGGIFGEMALIDDQPRMATAIATEPTTCLVIGERTFKDKLKRADPFIRGLLRVFVSHLRTVSEGYAELSRFQTDRFDAALGEAERDNLP